MSRFRLRLLLQEFELPLGRLIVGRSPDCHITIQDPMISRQHLEIVVTPNDVTLVDLGSRNGSRVNGRQLTEPAALSHGDRIRLGAQEMVFFELEAGQVSGRQTGSLLFCSQCATPCSEETRTCPHCGASPIHAHSEETLPGVSSGPRTSWVLQLFDQVFERALAAHKFVEAERILLGAFDEINSHAAAGETVEWPRLMQLAEYAVRLALIQQDARWIGRVCETFKSLACIPSDSLVDRLDDARRLPGAPVILDDMVDYWRRHHYGSLRNSVTILPNS